jgi:hypothetical protein
MARHRQRNISKALAAASMASAKNINGSEAESGVKEN